MLRFVFGAVVVFVVVAAAAVVVVLITGNFHIHGLFQ